MKGKFKWIVIGLIILVISMVAPVDWKPFEHSELHEKMMSKIDNLDLQTSKSENLLVGWAKVNITPTFPVTLVGYQPRGPHNEVHDSLYLSTMLFDNGKTELLVVTGDLLLFPPLVKERLKETLPDIGLTLDQVYFSATHSHTSFGGWDDKIMARFISGKYDEKIVELLARRTMESIQLARKNKSKAILGFKKIRAPYVENRVEGLGNIDDFLRVVKVQKQTGEVGTIISYAAHPTCISRKLLALSADYPGQLVQKLESAKNGVDFAMFCAGMVGSLRPRESLLDKKKNWELTNALSHRLSLNILAEMDSIPVKAVNNIGLTKIPIELPEPQMRIHSNWRLRPWVFEGIFGELNGNINVLQIGNLVMMGMPCDFSGEVYNDYQLGYTANSNGLELMITSFNGQYLGYINADKYYPTKEKEEIVILNWVGPHKGKYFGEMTQKILSTIGEY